MEQYIIKGGNPLVGEVVIGGAKNAALGILAAAIMTDGECLIDNMPNVRDTNVLLQAMEGIGATIDRKGDNEVVISGKNIDSTGDLIVDNEYIRKIRASYYLIGALLGKYRKAQVVLPGGCDIGSRPIDQHIKGFRALGAEVKIEHGMIIAQAEQLVGNRIYLDVVSVGATINIMMAASMAEGKTVIENAAKEIKEEFATSDADLKCVVDISEGCSTEAVTYEDSTRAVSLIQALPNGIMRMSQDIDNLVETSLNLGVISLDESGICLRFSLRSSVGAALKNLKSQIKFISEAFRANAECTGEYPAWEYKKDSKLRDDMVRIFEQMYGKKPTIEAIHAGVECGILAGKIEGLDCISMGPDIFDIHTTEEHLSISSTKRMYEYILNVIACK